VVVVVVVVLVVVVVVELQSWAVAAHQRLEQ